MESGQEGRCLNSSDLEKGGAHIALWEETGKEGTAPGLVVCHSVLGPTLR